MKTYFDKKYQKQIVTISPGEYHCSKQDCYISTVLGSCIAITLWDSRNKIGGMNHFMLASTSRECSISDDIAGRFGEYSMELLINDMIKAGAQKKYFQAKVFGGANIFKENLSATGPRVGAANIFFAFNYLETEGIPILKSDTGGVQARKILFEPLTNKVYLKRIKNSMQETQELETKEKSYIKTLEAKEKEKTTVSNDDIIWF